MIHLALKDTASKFLFAFSLLFALGAYAAPAQAQTTERLVFTIPFEFTAGTVRLPAGEYAVTRTSDTSLAYIIRSTDGRSVSIVAVKNTLRPNRANDRAKLVFNAYGEKYFLAQVQPGGYDLGKEFHKPRAEREMLRAETTSERVTIAAVR
ncbi:MAG: hypothetical protein WKF84_19215 [Pyrinomonadaceae bacterium]